MSSLFIESKTARRLWSAIRTFSLTLCRGIKSKPSERATSWNMLSAAAAGTQASLHAWLLKKEGTVATLPQLQASRMARKSCPVSSRRALQTIHWKLVTLYFRRARVAHESCKRVAVLGLSSFLGSWTISLQTKTPTKHWSQSTKHRTARTWWRQGVPGV
jgi:hypothetical protein